MEKFNDNLSQFTNIIKKLYPNQKEAIDKYYNFEEAGDKYLNYFFKRDSYFTKY